MFSWLKLHKSVSFERAYSFGLQPAVMIIIAVISRCMYQVYLVKKGFFEVIDLSAKFVRVVFACFSALVLTVTIAGLYSFTRIYTSW